MQFDYDKCASRFPNEDPVNGRIPFVYLTSPPFSGSTLFSFLVNTHPKIATVGEMTGLTTLQDPEAYRCSCSQKLKECDFWNRVAKQMLSQGFPFETGSFDTKFRLSNGVRMQRVLTGSLRNSLLEDVRDALLRLWPRQNKRLQYLLERNKAFAASILQVTGKPVFFDASKNPMTIRHLCRHPDLDLRVVHLVRDVRGASLSMRKNRGGTNWRRTVNAWVRANHNIERQLARLPADRWIRICYEDLCRAPAATLNRFFAFCGFEPHNIPRDFQAVEHHIVGNRMRLTHAGEIALDEAWRHVLTPDEHACAEKLAGAMQVRYGYPPMSVADLDRGPTEQDKYPGFRPMRRNP
jgi:hypothetical protein